MARRLYERVSHLPIVSPHGHTDPRWCAEDQPFPDPARLFVARRVDCAYLAELVVTHRLDGDEAHDLAYDLAYGLAKRAYKLRTNLGRKDYEVSRHHSPHVRERRG